MAKIEKIGNIQIVDNKEDKFFYFPMISMACTGSGYQSQCGVHAQVDDRGTELQRNGFRLHALQQPLHTAVRLQLFLAEPEGLQNVPLHIFRLEAGLLIRIHTFLDFGVVCKVIFSVISGIILHGLFRAFLLLLLLGIVCLCRPAGSVPPDIRIVLEILQLPGTGVDFQVGAELFSVAF